MTGGMNLRRGGKGRVKGAVGAPGRNHTRLFPPAATCALAQAQALSLAYPASSLLPPPLSAHPSPRTHVSSYSASSPRARGVAAAAARAPAPSNGLLLISSVSITMLMVSSCAPRTACTARTARTASRGYPANAPHPKRQPTGLHCGDPRAQMTSSALGSTTKHPGQPLPAGELPSPSTPLPLGSRAKRAQRGVLTHPTAETGTTQASWRAAMRTNSPFSGQKSSYLRNNARIRARTTPSSRTHAPETLDVSEDSGAVSRYCAAHRPAMPGHPGTAELRRAPFALPSLDCCVA